MSTRFDYESCEPFRAWNRIEPRVRKEEFDRALQSEVHDALWMLTRQWQFGEFKGEDTGSAIFAKTLLKTSRLTRFKPRNRPSQDYHDHIPLETLVESEPQQYDFRTRLQAGRRFLSILNDLGTEFNAIAGGRPLFSLTDYQAKLVELFSFTLPQDPTPTAATNDHHKDIQTSKLLTNHALHPFTTALRGRSIDGILLYLAIKDDSVVAINWKLHGAHEDLLLNAANIYKGWIQTKFAEAISQQSSWNPSQLEYQFACAAPKHDGGSVALLADEYYHGRLDWYAFNYDMEPEDAGLMNTTTTRREEALHQEIISMIPTPASYPGMPNGRLWEFEDGAVDLGNISADTTDLAKVILSEFALIYGNDWFVLPYPIAVGSLCDIAGIIITDVFGQKTLVESASQGQSDDWESWGLFNLSGKAQVNQRSSKSSNSLFLPPAVSKVHESEAIEEVLFVRDEMANLTWGIETKVPDLLGRSLDGHIAASELNNYWLTIQGIDLDAEPVIDEKAIYKYTLGNTIPENWIPFTAIHKKDGQNRAVRLQRASMPRLYFEDFQAIRPRTDILRYGLRNDPDLELAPFVNPSRETQESPYYINEEEVPRAGLKLTSTFQRTRWYNGKTYSWYGRRKTLGRGEGSSGLAFDILEMARKNKP